MQATHGRFAMHWRDAGQDRGRLTPKQSKRDATEHQLVAGVIVVGSTSVALLVEALAQAELLRCGACPEERPHQSLTVRRASSWAEAAELAGRHAPCVLVAAGGEAPSVAPTDATGAAARVIDAETVLRQSRKSAARHEGDRGMQGRLVALWRALRVRALPRP